MPDGAFAEDAAFVCARIGLTNRIGAKGFRCSMA